MLAHLKIFFIPFRTSGYAQFFFSFLVLLWLSYSFKDMYTYTLGGHLHGNCWSEQDPERPGPKKNIFALYFLGGAQRPQTWAPVYTAVLLCVINDIFFLQNGIFLSMQELNNEQMTNKTEWGQYLSGNSQTSEYVHLKGTSSILVGFCASSFFLALLDFSLQF